MAGPQDIQRYPKGLIDLLGMRATGDTPHQLAQQTIGNLGLLDFYLSDRCEVLDTPTPIALPGLGTISFQNSTVPAGQAWLIYEASVIVPPIAALAGLRTTPLIFRTNTAAAFGVQIAPTMTCATTEGNMSGSHFEHPLLAQAGQSFGLYTSIFTGAPATTPRLTLYFARILV
jgi:hypothetical protein